MLRVVGRRHFTNIAINSLEGRYATALFTAASKKGNLQEVEREVSQLKAWLTESRASILSSPAYDSSQKLSLVQLATKNLSDGLFTRFLQVVHENKRFELLPAIMSVFSKLSEISRGAVAVTVTSHEVSKSCGCIILIFPIRKSVQRSEKGFVRR